MKNHAVSTVLPHVFRPHLHIWKTLPARSGSSRCRAALEIGGFHRIHCLAVPESQDESRKLEKSKKRKRIKRGLNFSLFKWVFWIEMKWNEWIWRREFSWEMHRLQESNSNSRVIDWLQHMSVGFVLSSSQFFAVLGHDHSSVSMKAHIVTLRRVFCWLAPWHCLVAHCVSLFIDHDVHRPRNYMTSYDIFSVLWGSTRSPGWNIHRSDPQFHSSWLGLALRFTYITYIDLHYDSGFCLFW